MFLVQNLAITAALTNQVVGLTLESVRENPLSLGMFCNLVGFTGGTSIDAYVQTSFDGGNSFWDVGNFHLTGAGAFNLCTSALDPITPKATLLFHALAANTAQDGLIGSQWQLMVTSVGVFTAASLSIYMQTDKPLKVKFAAGID